MSTLLDRQYFSCCESFKYLPGAGGPLNDRETIDLIFPHRCCPSITLGSQHYYKQVDPCGLQIEYDDSWGATYYRQRITYRWAWNSASQEWELYKNTRTYTSINNGAACETDSTGPVFVRSEEGTFNNEPETPPTEYLEEWVAEASLPDYDEIEDYNSGSASSLEAYRSPGNKNVGDYLIRRFEYFVLATGLIPGLTYKYQIARVTRDTTDPSDPITGTTETTEIIEFEFTPEKTYYIHGGTLNVSEAAFIAGGYDKADITPDGTLEEPYPPVNGEIETTILFGLTSSDRITIFPVNSFEK